MKRVARVDGVDVVAAFGDVASEVETIRRSVGLTALPHVSVVRVVGDDARSFLERVLAGDLRVRDGQVRQTLILDESGEPLADVYVCNDDDRYLLLCDGVPRRALLEHLAAHRAPAADVVLEDLAESHELLSLNGPFAWELMSRLEGPGVVGFPYLSFYHAHGGSLFVRAGKTGEFGYELLVPAKESAAARERLLDGGRALDLAEVGVEALWRCALENWFFNPHRHRAPGVTPVELQLQWRLSHKKDYVGSRAIAERRAAGARVRATGLTSRAPVAVGDVVSLDGAPIGTVLDAHRCDALDAWVAMALIDARLAHSGIDRFAIQGERVTTTSPPFINNLSLYVNPQRDSYGARESVAFPGPRPERGAA